MKNQNYEFLKISINCTFKFNVKNSNLKKFVTFCYFLIKLKIFIYNSTCYAEDYVQNLLLLKIQF